MCFCILRLAAWRTLCRWRRRDNFLVCNNDCRDIIHVCWELYVVSQKLKNGEGVFGSLVVAGEKTYCGSCSLGLAKDIGPANAKQHHATENHWGKLLDLDVRRKDLLVDKYPCCLGHVHGRKSRSCSGGGRWRSGLRKKWRKEFSWLCTKYCLLHLVHAWRTQFGCMERIHTAYRRHLVLERSHD